jgi:AmpE protein
MTFIITLVSLIMERFFHWTQLRTWRWFGQYQRWLGTRIGNWPSAVLLIVCILPLVLVVGVINCLLAGWLYGVLKLLFGIAVLMYCLGPKNLWVQVYSCITELHKEDPKAVIDQVQSSFGVSATSNSQAFHIAFTRAIFVEAYYRVFAVIFWFLILGPVGAIFYRALSLCGKDSPLGVSKLATKVQNVLDWVPVRLFTFIFALGGHFTEVFNIWKHSMKKGFIFNEILLADCGVAALDVMEENRIPEEGSAEKEALALVDRVFVMCLVVVAIIILLTY